MSPAVTCVQNQNIPNVVAVRFEWDQFVHSFFFGIVFFTFAGALDTAATEAWRVPLSPLSCTRGFDVSETASLEFYMIVSA